VAVIFPEHFQSFTVALKKKYFFYSLAPNYLSCLLKHKYKQKDTFQQCCGSGMFISDPNFYRSWIPDPVSRIPDPKTVTKERGEKKLVFIPFL
jgi:hypothetical protein